MDLKHENSTKQKPATRPFVYFIIGVILAIINFVIYTIFARLIFNDNSTLWLSTLISTTITTIIAYFLHSKITWRDRIVTKSSIIRFFIWNLATAIIINPGLTWVFSFITPVYQFAFNVSSSLNLPFDYNFVESTSIFIFVGIITMIINYLFYDKFVFNKNKKYAKIDIYE